MISTVSNLVCIGSSVALSLGLISKLIQVIRFINVGYSPQLSEILTTWGTDVLNVNIPSQINKQIVAGDIPSIFTDFGVEPSFLSNIWGTLITLGSSLIICIACKVILCFLSPPSNSCYKIICTLLKGSSKAAFNFLIVSLYEGIGDVVFFTVLEMKSLSFKSASSCVSFCLSILFMLLGCCLVSMHWRLLIRYRRLKLQLGTHSSEGLEEFKEKHSGLKVLFEDFRDESLLQHGFLSILVVRDTAVSLIMTTMVSYPLIQSAMLASFSVCMCGYLALKNPFKHRLERAAQIFLEVCLLTVNLSVLSFAILDSLGEPAITKRRRLGLGISASNIIINAAGVIIMGLRISQEVRNAYREYCERKKRLKVNEVIDLSRLKRDGPDKANDRSNDDKSFIDNSLLHQNSPLVVPNRARVKVNSEKRREQKVGGSDLFEESSSSIKALVGANQGSRISAATQNLQKTKKKSRVVAIPEQALLSNLGAKTRKIYPVQMPIEEKGRLSPVGYDLESPEKQNNSAIKLEDYQWSQNRESVRKANRERRAPNIQKKNQEAVNNESREIESFSNRIPEDRLAIKRGSPYPVEFYMDFLDRTMEQIARSNKSRVYKEPKDKARLSLSNIYGPKALKKY